MHSVALSGWIYVRTLRKAQFQAKNSQSWPLTVAKRFVFHIRCDDTLCFPMATSPSIDQLVAAAAVLRAEQSHGPSLAALERAASLLHSSGHSSAEASPFAAALLSRCCSCCTVAVDNHRLDLIEVLVVAAASLTSSVTANSGLGSCDLGSDRQRLRLVKCVATLLHELNLLLQASPLEALSPGGCDVRLVTSRLVVVSAELLMNYSIWIRDALMMQVSSDDSATDGRDAHRSLRMSASAYAAASHFIGAEAPNPALRLTRALPLLLETMLWYAHSARQNGPAKMQTDAFSVAAETDVLAVFEAVAAPIPATQPHSPRIVHATDGASLPEHSDGEENDVSPTGLLSGDDELLLSCCNLLESVSEHDSSSARVIGAWLKLWEVDISFLPSTQKLPSQPLVACLTSMGDPCILLISLLHTINWDAAELANLLLQTKQNSRRSERNGSPDSPSYTRLISAVVQCPPARLLAACAAWDSVGQLHSDSAASLDADGSGSERTGGETGLGGGVHSPYAATAAVAAAVGAAYSEKGAQLCTSSCGCCGCRVTGCISRAATLYGRSIGGPSAGVERQQVGDVSSAATANDSLLSQLLTIASGQLCLNRGEGLV